MRILALVAALLAAPAHADRLATHSETGDSIRLLNVACSVPSVLALLREEYRPQFRRLAASLGGKTVSGCWIDMPGGETVYLMLEDGREAVLPASAFRETPSA